MTGTDDADRAGAPPPDPGTRVGPPAPAAPVSAYPPPVPPAPRAPAGPSSGSTAPLYPYAAPTVAPAPRSSRRLVLAVVAAVVLVLGGGVWFLASRSSGTTPQAGTSASQGSSGSATGSATPSGAATATDTASPSDNPSSTDATTQVTASSTPVAGGQQLSNRGVSIVVPRDWRQVPTSPADLSAMADKLKADNPAMARALQQFASSPAVGQFVLFALGPATDAGVFPNVNVILSSTGGASASEMASGIKMELATAGAKDLAVTEENVAGTDGLVARYTLSVKDSGGSSHLARGTVYVAIKDSQAAIVTVTNDDGTFGRAIADSVTF